MQEGDTSVAAVSPIRFYSGDAPAAVAAPELRFGFLRAGEVVVPILGVPVVVPPPGEAVADGAARQAAWVLSGSKEPPSWQAGSVETRVSPPDGATRNRYRRAAQAAASVLASADDRT